MFAYMCKRCVVCAMHEWVAMGHVIHNDRCTRVLGVVDRQ